MEKRTDFENHIYDCNYIFHHFTGITSTYELCELKFSLRYCKFYYGSTVVKALCYKSEGRWFDSRCCHWHNPSDRTMALGSTQLLTEMSQKVKQSHYRPGQAQRFPGSLGSQISWQRHRMVVSCQPYAPAAFTPRKCTWYSFLLEAESTPGP